MGSTFFSLHYHIVFSTKERRPFIKPAWQPRLHAYLGGIIKGMNGVPEIVGGVEDQVHILPSPEASALPCGCTSRLEEGIVHVAKENFNHRFTWPEGYAAFTVSATATDSVRRYIATQEAHHRKHSFVDELRELLNAAGVEFDEKYLWFTSGTPSGCGHD